MHRRVFKCILGVLLRLLFLSAEWSSWLPLYGNLCSQLVAQPVCMTHSMMCGYLSQKVAFVPGKVSLLRIRVPFSLFFGRFFRKAWRV